jgi:hypothetical protein
VDMVPNVNEDQARTDNGLLKDLGAASERTRGMAIEWPWYENSAPPFNHVYCPYC